MSGTPDLDPIDAKAGRYRVALRGVPAARLRVAVTNLRGDELARAGNASALAATIRQRLEAPGGLDEAIEQAGPAARAGLWLFAARERDELPAWDWFHAVAALDFDPLATLGSLLDWGLAAPLLPTWPESWHREDPSWRVASIVLHPGARDRARWEPLPFLTPPPAGPARRERGTDGLEMILRVAAAWQRLREAPLRRTQTGSLYKRDQDRLDEDPALAGPIADAIEPLPGMPRLWLDLALGADLARAEPVTERLVAAPAAAWVEHAVHLPRMLAVAWLNAGRWHDRLGPQSDTSDRPLGLPALRLVPLLALAGLPPEGWADLEELERRLIGRYPDWSRLVLGPIPDHPPPPPPAPDEPPPRRGRRGAAKAAREEANLPFEAARSDPVADLRALLLGPAYLLGLVRVAEEVPSGRRLIQLAAAGRYVLGIGPPPPPPPAFEQFLMVQPNFEVIAYRQGLNLHALAELIGFLRITRVGGALELKLTPESVYAGLEDGQTPEGMIARLGRHAARPPAAGVVEAIRTWSVRREKVTYRASATLLEFAATADVDAALAAWPESAGNPPERVGTRLLLVEEASSIPFAQFRLTGARDYRADREPCVEVEADGIHLKLDLARSDLMVDAELARFAEDLGASGFARRYRVSPISLGRGIEDGLTPARLNRWFVERTGHSTPAAVGLLLAALIPPEPPRLAGPWALERLLVLELDNPALVDGLMQHPLTRPALGRRLGPRAVEIPAGRLPAFRKALAELGLTVALAEEGDGSPPPPP